MAVGAIGARLEWTQIHWMIEIGDLIGQIEGFFFAFALSGDQVAGVAVM